MALYTVSLALVPKDWGIEPPGGPIETVPSRHYASFSTSGTGMETW